MCPVLPHHQQGRSCLAFRASLQSRVECDALPQLMHFSVVGLAAPGSLPGAASTAGGPRAPAGAAPPCPKRRGAPRFPNRLKRFWMARMSARLDVGPMDSRASMSSGEGKSSGAPVNSASILCTPARGLARRAWSSACHSRSSSIWILIHSLIWLRSLKSSSFRNTSRRSAVGRIRSSWLRRSSGSMGWPPASR